MTYTDDPQPYKLAWSDDPTREGLEVLCTGSSLAARVAVERFEQRVTAGKRIRDKDIARLARVFVRHVQRWTIRRKSGALVPLTAKGVMSLDRNETVMPMLRQWIALVSQPVVPTAEDPAGATAGDAVAEETAAFLATFEARTASVPEPDEYLVQDTDDTVQAPALEPAPV